MGKEASDTHHPQETQNIDVEPYTIRLGNEVGGKHEVNFYPEPPLDPGNVLSKVLEQVFCSITDHSA